jgi:hypothetical protein
LTDVPAICSVLGSTEIRVRLTIVIGIAAASAILLPVYFLGTIPRSHWRRIAENVSNWALRGGSPEHANCRFERAREARHDGHHQLRQTEHLQASSPASTPSNALSAATAPMITQHPNFCWISSAAGKRRCFPATLRGGAFGKLREDDGAAPAAPDDGFAPLNPPADGTIAASVKLAGFGAGRIRDGRPNPQHLRKRPIAVKSRDIRNPRSRHECDREAAAARRARCTP